MSKIKRFFSKKKEEAAFKLKLDGALGQGHTLNTQSSEASTSRNTSGHIGYIPGKRRELSVEAKAAASAALARIDKKDSKEFNTSLAAIKAQAKKELEEEKKSKKEVLSDTSKDDNISNINYACQGVYFRCPIISEEVLTKREWKNKIKEFLYQQLEDEKALTSCLIIVNCNSKEKAHECVKTLKIYLENIINFPEEEKYYKIRMSNRVFCEKVRFVEGALDFLSAVGFREVQLDGELYLIWSKDCVDKDYELATLLESLLNAEPLQLLLDRNLKVLLPSQVKSINLPEDFYHISPEDVKRQQKSRAEAIENAQSLKTKAMRDREEQRILRMYKYSLVRIKFPCGIYIQGTFNVYDKIGDIFEFVQSCLRDETLEFSLVAPSEGKLSEDDINKTLYDLRFVPTITLLFKVFNETGQDANFIKEEVLLLVESI